MHNQKHEPQRNCVKVTKKGTMTMTIYLFIIQRETKIFGILFGSICGVEAREPTQMDRNVSIRELFDSTKNLCKAKSFCFNAFFAFDN